MKVETKVGYLKDEYFFVQKLYEDFDGRILVIKGWGTTVGLSGIGLAFSSHTPAIWLFASFASVVFWVLEAMWKSFQYMYGTRIVELERAFKEGEFGELAPLQIYTRWFDHLQAHGWQLWRNCGLLLVALPHALTAALGIGLYVGHELGWGWLQFPSPQR